MSNQDNQIVVAFDFGHAAREALYSAVALAKRSADNVLHFICVIEPHKANPHVPFNGPIDFKYTEVVQQKLLDAIAPELELAKITNRVHFFVHVRIGKPAEEILNLAREVGADQILIGTKGLTGVEHFVLGSVAEKVVREAGCPVVVARRKTYDYVPRLEITEVQAHASYVPPHRYFYEDHRIELRPSAWPLY